MKKKILWPAAAALFLVLGIAAFCTKAFCESRSEGIESADITTGDMNQSLAYDRMRGVMYVGTHGGVLSAWQDDKELWKTKTEGAYRKLVLGAGGDRLYAANESNHVYVFRTSDGELLLDIDVQRKAVGVAVNADESKIAVITNTGSSKSNLMIFSADGTELANTPYTLSLRGAEYCEDGDTLMLANKRGDVEHVTESGEVLASYGANYEIIQMKACAGGYWAVAKDGSWFGLDENLECIRKGKIDNTVKAKISSIGVDTGGEYVAVGTEEGYLFVMDPGGRQIYMADMKMKITDSASDEGRIFLAGYGDAVFCTHAKNLQNIELYQKLDSILRTALRVIAAAFLICVIGSVPKLKAASLRLLKQMWKQRMAYVMLIPTFVLLYLFSYRGIFTALTRAFTDWSVKKGSVAEFNFIGLDNFRTMLTEGYFLIGLKNLLLLLAANIVKTLTVPMAIAWMLFNIAGARRKYVHRFLFVLPMVVPGVVTALVWQKIYDPSIGLLNQILGAVGLTSMQRVWLGDSSTAMGAVIFMGFPFVGAMALLVYYGGLLNIGNDVIESALIDGGTKWDIFWKVQLPMIRPQISIMMTLTVLGAMQEFNSIFILTSGGPGTATYVPALELYLNAAQYGRYGYASALGVVLLVFTMAVTLVSNKLTKERE